MPELLPRDTVLHIRDTCQCLAAQRAPRRLPRRFDAALKPFGLTNRQFSLMVSLKEPKPPLIGRLAPFLAMDPSSLTAAVKPLERRGLLTVEPDLYDRRTRSTREGVAIMRQAAAVWRAEQTKLDAELTSTTAEPTTQVLGKIASA